MPSLLDLVLEQGGLSAADVPEPADAPEQPPVQQTTDSPRRLPTFYDAVVNQREGATTGIAELSTARANAENETPSVLRAVAGRLPFIRNAFNFGDALMTDRAQARIAQNQGTQADFSRVASSERLQQFRSEMTPGENFAETLMDIPAMTVEAMGAGRLIGTRFAPTAGASLGNRAANYAGQSAATAGLMGGWLPRWTENNQSQGRAALDLRGLPPAFAHETATMAVLGSLGHFGDSVGANNIGGFLQRGLARVGLGMAEQAGLDVATSAIQRSVQNVFHHDLGWDTGFGLVGQIARGEGHEALANATQQALTFAVFAGMHEAQRTPVMREYSAGLRDLRRSGTSAEEAGRRMSDVTSLMQGATERDLTRAEARTLLETAVPEGPARRYGQSLLATMPEKPPERFGPPRPPAKPEVQAPAPVAPKPKEARTVAESPGTPPRTSPAPETNPVKEAADRLTATQQQLTKVSEQFDALKNKGVPPENRRYDPILAEHKRLSAEQITNTNLLNDAMRSQRGTPEARQGVPASKAAPESPQTVQTPPERSPTSKLQAATDRATMRQALGDTPPTLPSVPKRPTVESKPVERPQSGPAGMSDTKLRELKGKGYPGVDAELARRQVEQPTLVLRPGARGVRPAEPQAAKPLGLNALQEGTLAKVRDPAKQEFLRQNFLRQNAQAKTLYDAVVNKGGISPKSIASYGLDFKMLRDSFPKALFSKGGQSLEEIVGGSEIGRQIWGDRPETAADKIHRGDEFFQKLANHYLLDPGDWFAHEQAASHLEALKEDLHEQFAKLGLRGPTLEAAVNTEARSRLEGIDRVSHEAALESHDFGDAWEGPTVPRSQSQTGGRPESRTPEAAPVRTPEPRTVPAEAPGTPVTPEERARLLGGGQEGALPPRQPEPAAAIANASIDAWREQNGLPQVLSDARRADPVVWDRAMQRLSEDPMAGVRLVEEINRKPRPTTDEENAILLRETVAARNERSRNMLELIDAYQQRVREGGKDKVTPETAARIAQAENAERDLAERVDRTDKASRLSGSEWGRAGRWRRQLLAEDFTLAGILQRAEAAKGDRLTEKERTEIADLHAKLKDAQDKLAAAEADGRVKPGTASNEGFAEEQARKPITRIITKLKEQNQPWTVKAWRGSVEAWNFPKSAASMIDFPWFRQGWLMITHPVDFANAAKLSLRAFGSEPAAARAEYNVLHRPGAEIGEAAGLDLSAREGSLRQREEGFLSNVASLANVEEMRKNHPVAGLLFKLLTSPIRGSERGYVTFLNELRARRFDAMASYLAKDGKLTDSEGKVIANAVNVMTGRGALTQTPEKALGLLNATFFAPRWVISRFQYLMFQPIWGSFGESAPRARKLVAMEYGRQLAGLGTVLGLAAAAGFKVVMDPRSSEFGQMQVGDTFLDLTGGLRRAATFLSRTGTGKSVDQFGVPHPLVGDVPPGQPDWIGTLTDFGRRSLAPVPSAAINIRRGEDPLHRPTTTGRELGNLVSPLFARDVAEAMKDLGVEKGTAASLMGLMGMGMVTHTDEPRQAPPRTAASVLENRIRGDLRTLENAMRGHRVVNGRVVRVAPPTETQKASIQSRIDALVRMLPR